MDENNIIVRVTGEADLNEAQLEMRELAERGKDLERQMQDLAKAEKADIANINAWIKDAARREVEIQKTAASYKQQRAELQQQITANNKSIQSLKQSVSAYNAVQGAGAKMSQELKAIREQLSQMEMAGDTSSQAFIDLSVRAAELTDQIGDTQAQIRVLSSDTKNLDAALSAGSGLTGAFNVATSAAALLGGESDELQQAFLKVQAAMAVLNGVQQVSNTLNKDSAAMVVLRTAYARLFTKEKVKEAAATAANTTATAAETTATGAATAAQWSLNAAMAANPIGAIVTLVVAAVAALGALTYGVYKLITAFGGEAKAARAAKKAQEDYDNQSKLTSYNLNMLAKAHDKLMRQMERDETSEMNAAKKRHATNLEMYEIELGYLKKKSAETLAYANDAITANNKEQIAANEAFNAKMKELSYKKKGSKEYFETLQQLNEAERQMNEVYKRGVDIIKERDDAKQAVIEMEQQIADERLAIQDKLNQSRVNLMKDGAEKEIAQVKLTYEQQLREVQKGSALYKSLIAERNAAIEEINRQSNLRVQAAMVQELKNESDANANDLELRKMYYEEDAKYKVASLDQKKMSEEEYSNAVEEIQIDLNNKLRDIESERIDRELAANNDSLVHAQNLANEILETRGLTFEEEMNARARLFEFQQLQLQNEKDALDEHYENGEMTYEEYNRRLEEISHERNMNEIAYENEKFDMQRQKAEEVLSTINDYASQVFSIISDGIQNEMDQLDAMYTTDAEEARTNSNKRYITEEELEKKKTALRRKAAAAQKAEAAFGIVMNTAQAIMRIWADVPKFDFGVSTGILTGIAAGLGAAQLAMVLAKPLPQYAKGRAGGKGEFAMVGERGAELMYVPEGASIVPHDKLSRPDLWGQYGIPEGKRPVMPHLDADVAGYLIAQQLGGGVDYKKLGRTIAENVRIPDQKAVHVNIDRSGILVSEGNDTHHVLNTKYEATWI